ncbi:DNA-binding MarR family transcriptional regulator [Actinomadura coerulea]|uniref:DNA-binding MarR family transcriptional regulator n=1 Tax=Actinomadura coerulea TaxID=46159 RepID=A0A7X0L246_9ACTN|nr:MarR family winged helix-turn-helix transcriptional regulator [Actinomadura coerulea]MBB6399195.1 DNA-binding MarR family transcriptional regulator [Actinomadura coerulea]GGQ24054.1 MarR family transcriptional regulator [Actinomadura coerulea]
MDNAPRDPETDDSALLDQIGPALSRLRRRTTGGRADLTRNLVLNVVANAPGEMTVGGLAAEMGVTQPVASRTVAACITDGLLRRAASQADSRRTVLELTDAGEAERRRFASEQRETFEDITAAWKPAERVQFARLLVRYSEDAGAWSARQRRRGQDGAGTLSDD